MKLRRKRYSHAWVDSADPIVTERLEVVPITPELDASYLALFDDDFLTTHHWTAAMVDALDMSLRAGRSLRHAITKSTAVLVLGDEPLVAIGFISIARNPKRRQNEHLIGLQISREHRGKGYTTEALPAILHHIERADISNVVLATSENNLAMIRVCEKLGFCHQAERYKHPDGTEEMARVYRVLPRQPSHSSTSRIDW